MLQGGFCVGYKGSIISKKRQCVLTSLLAGLVLLAVATWQLVIGGANLLENPSFESSPKRPWKAIGFKAARETDPDLVKDGSYSLLVKNRINAASGPAHLNIPFVKGRHYGFEGYVKLLNDVKNTLWQTVKATVQMNLLDGSTISYNIAFRSFCRADQGWILLKGDIEAPEVDFNEPRLVIRGPATQVNFVVDNLTLYELPEDPLWRQKVEANIERVRKSNIQLNVHLPQDVPLPKLEVEVKLKQHQFAFGSMLRDDVILTEPPLKVMDMAYSFFQWGSIQNYKWKFLKGDPVENPDMSDALRSTKVLKSHGLKVRGHSIFWDVEKNIPDKVRLQVPQKQMPSVLHRHLERVMTKARNLISQWDVQNEHIAMHFYEEKTQNPDLTKLMFEWAKQMNDSGQLYLNEFQCVTSGAQTEQLLDLAREYVRQGIPLQGIGIQGHTKTFVRPDPTAMRRRIDRLAELGLPIMMTEFDLGWPDQIQRADWFEDSIRAFFGHPNMHGVILWDFWNETMKYPDKDLVRGTGDNLEILEVGQRWACLVNKEWHTQARFQVTQPFTPLSLRGFRGLYDVLVRKGGVVVQREEFYLGDEDPTWNLHVTASTDPITVKTKTDFVPECISHREMRDLGSSKTASKEAGLKCTAVQSAWSGTAADDSVSVSCPGDAVMTACLSFQKDSSWKRNGEKIEVDSNSGSVSCVAYNSHKGGGGVMAVAVCCGGSGLQCDYRRAGPSFPLDGAMAEVTCPSGRQALGCSSYSQYPVSDGVRPNDDLTGCRAQSGGPNSSDPLEKSGVLVYAACCKTTRKALRCTVENSQPSGLKSGSVITATCPANTVLTGCNAFAEDGKAAGAKIKESNKCKATLGASLPKGSTGVRAYAICCSI